MLQAHRLNYTAPSGRRLQDLTLGFFPGEVHGLLGPNGAGKSTFLKMLAGLLPPTSGTVFWQNAPLLTKGREAISRTITLVPQDLHVTFEFTVEEIVAMGRYKRSITSQELLRYLELVDAAHLAGRLITELSQGEKQMVFLARALTAECPILLFDEPTNALDIQHQMRIWNLLKKIAELGKIVVVATHDLRAAKQYCNKLTLMDQGALVATGCHQEVLTEKYMSQVFRIVTGLQDFTG